MSDKSEENARGGQPGLLRDIARILELSKGSGLDEAFFEEAAPQLEHVAREMEISHLQAALFAHILDTSFLKNHYNLPADESLLNSLKCGKCKYLEYMDEIEELAKRKYVTVAKHFGTQSMPDYIVPSDIIFSLRKGEPIKPKSRKILSATKFFSELRTVFEARFSSEMLFVDFIRTLDSLMDENPHLGFIQKINGLKLDTLDRNLLLFFCSRNMGSQQGVTLQQISELFEDEIHGSLIEAQLIYPLETGNHCLQELGLIENANHEGFAFYGEFVLTEKATDTILDEFMNKKTQAGKNPKGFFPATGIKKKAMFYNPGVEEKVKQLGSFLEQENFKKIIGRLAERGLRGGIACLFYGDPGTGKTETVFQLARKAGRGLM
ncbi:MAG: ATP-binding protein, partial [Spirochaetia bacterium]|nr:ATP-binding protein [Spirochaetia bacterium]